MNRWVAQKATATGWVTTYAGDRFSQAVRFYDGTAHTRLIHKGRVLKPSAQLDIFQEVS